MKNSVNHYEKLSDIFYPLDITGSDKDLVGDKSIQSCIFCGQKRPQVSFKKEAHVIPAGLGNRTLFYVNECDSCNEIFSYYENELINYLTFDRIFINAQKRPGSGLPRYKQKGKQSNLSMNRDSNNLNIEIFNNEGVFEIEEKNNEKKMRFTINNTPPYRPSDICKCLTHMAWALMEEADRASVDYVPDWLLGKVDIFPLYMETAFVKGNGYSNVILEVFKTKTEESKNYPYLIRFTFGLHIISFYLPIEPEIKVEPILFNFCEHIPQGVPVSPTIWTINGEERIKPENTVFEWGFREKE